MVYSLVPFPATREGDRAISVSGTMLVRSTPRLAQISAQTNPGSLSLQRISKLLCSREERPENSRMDRSADHCEVKFDPRNGDWINSR